MARNVEIKARVHDVDAVRAKAAALASSPGEIVQQTDTFFAVPAGRLKVRELADGSGELIAYERPNQPGPKESSYSRFICTDARALTRTLSRVLATRGTVVKQREVFLIGRTRVHLDHVEGLGAFVELEVVLAVDEAVEDGNRDAQGLLDALEIPQAALVAEAYIDLLETARV
jgi:predicted adenylyl cyclase CyaB